MQDMDCKRKENEYENTKQQLRKEEQEGNS